MDNPAVATPFQGAPVTDPAARPSRSARRAARDATPAPVSAAKVPARRKPPVAKPKTAKKASPAKPKVDMEEALRPKTAEERMTLDGRAELRLVDINDLIPDPDNPRTTYIEVEEEEFRRSLAEEGMLQPIIARYADASRSQLMIMFGHRRHANAKRLGWTKVPVVIRYGVTDASILVKQLMENVHRSGMAPVDEGRAIRRFMREQRIATMDDAAKRLGKSLPWVSGRLALLDLDVDAQDAVNTKKLTLADAIRESRTKTGNTRDRSGSSSSGGGLAGRPLGRTSAAPSVESHRLGHFNDEHDLAGRVRSRCRAHGMPRPTIGGVGCGACWEWVIRSDERRRAIHGG